jgi:hypothetical protein
MAHSTNYRYPFPQHDFDEEEFFEKEIDPLMRKVHKLCDERNIPFVANFMYGRKGPAVKQNICCMLNKSKHRLFHKLSVMEKIASEEGSVEITVTKIKEDGDVQVH